MHLQSKRLHEQFLTHKQSRMTETGSSENCRLISTKYFKGCQKQAKLHQHLLYTGIIRVQPEVSWKGKCSSIGRTKESKSLQCHTSQRCLAGEGGKRATGAATETP